MHRLQVLWKNIQNIQSVVLAIIFRMLNNHFLSRFLNYLHKNMNLRKYQVVNVDLKLHEKHFCSSVYIYVVTILNCNYNMQLFEGLSGIFKALHPPFRTIEVDFISLK